MEVGKSKMKVLVSVESLLAVSSCTGRWERKRLKPV
jgi:hypothetical protein